MPNFTFANNINTTLASPVSSSATSITLSSSANLPTSIPAGQVLVITLNDLATRENFEIIYATAVSGATLSGLSRGQEGTAALSWLTGDYAFSGPTKGQMGNFAQVAQLASVAGTFSKLRASANYGATSVNFTAESIIVSTGIGGSNALITNFSQTFNPSTVGAGGMDFGSATASSWVAVYAAVNEQTGAQTIFGTLEGSSAAPTVYAGAHPISGYTYTSLLAVVPISAVANQFGGFNVINRLTQSNGPQILSGNTSATSQPGYSTLTTTGIPKTAISLIAGVSMTNSLASDSQFSAGPTSNGIGALQVSANTSSFGGNSQSMEIGLMSPQTVYYAAWGTNASNVFDYTMIVYGWKI